MPECIGRSSSAIRALRVNCGLGHHLDCWGKRSVSVFCGIDWAEDHHDAAIVDDAGVVLKMRRSQDSACGSQELLELLAAGWAAAVRQSRS